MVLIFKQLLKRENLFAFLAVSIVLAKRFLIADYGINREAGGEFEAVLQILEGKLVYRDFFWYLGFAPLYLNALLFKLASPEVYWIRLNEVFFAALGAFFAFKVARRLLSPAWTLVATVLAYSGLVTPLHVSGQLAAVTIEIISLYFLLDYVETKSDRSIFWCGFFCGTTFLFQIFPVGIVTLFGSLFALALYWVFDSREHLHKIKAFLCGFIPLPFVAYGLLIVFVPSDDLIHSVFPMFTGYESSPTVYASYPIPGLVPEIGFRSSPGETMGALNRFLVVNLRWWMIILVFFWGLAEFFIAQNKKLMDPKKLLILGTLVLFSPLFEIKFLLILGRLGVTPSVINMLPTYVLLFFLLENRCRKPFVSAGAGTALICVLFVYPVYKYYDYFLRNAAPLELSFASHIKVSPYKKDLYQNAVNFIKTHSHSGEFIVTAGINRYFSVFSERPDLFRANFLTFLQATFYPSRKVTGLMSASRNIEQGLVEKIETGSVKIILLPRDFRAGAPDDSPFLKYLDENWRMVAVFGDRKRANPYDWESPIEAYLPK